MGDVILEYDDNGNVISSQDQDTRTSLMEYDGKNRLVKVTDPLSHSTEFFFDPAGNLIQIKDAKGRLTSLAYNNLNCLECVSNALSQKTRFEYNATGRLTKVTDALNRETNLVYDAAGRQWERISWDENLETGTDVKFQVAFSNDAAGPWSYIGPDGTSGTVFTTNTGEDFDATSDFEGRYARFKVTLTGDGTETPSFSNVHLSFSGEGLLESRVQNYQYDEAGNITMVTTVTDAGTSTDERTHNDLNQITEQVVGGDTWTFSYDDNGNMTRKTDGTDTWTYTWTGDENRLIRVQGPGSIDVVYTYDSMGRMLTRDDGTLTTLVWDSWTCIKEVAGESETTYFAPQGQILSFSRNGERYELHSDALGSCRMITDENGEVVSRYEYGAWGNELARKSRPHHRNLTFARLISSQALSLFRE